MAKTANSNFGLGEVRSQDRNPRVKPKSQADMRGWKFNRIKLFQRNLRMAVVAKGYRLMMGVTQQEVANFYGVTASTVCGWESGKYNWPGGRAEVEEYIDHVRKIGNRPYKG